MIKSTLLRCNRINWIVLAFLGMALSCKKTNTASGGLTESGAPTQTLYSLAAGNSSLSIFTAALQRSHLDSVLKAAGPYTVFAPDDTAFQAAGLSLGKIQAMDPDSLKQLVAYHIVPGFYLSTSTKAYLTYRLRNLDSLYLFVDNGMEYVTSDLQAPIFPDEYYVDGRMPTAIDSQAVNGTLNVVGGLLVDPAYTFKGIQDLLSSDTSFSLFDYALQQSGLDVRFLSPASLKGSYATVFAPTNQAMINAGYVDKATIDNQNPDSLRYIMEYHILSSASAPLFHNDLLLATTGVTFDNSTQFSTKPNTTQGYGYLYTVTEIQAFAFQWALLVQTDANRHVTLLPWSRYNFGGNIYIDYNDQSNVPAAPLVTSNGVVYAVDRVLVPNMASTPNQH